METDKKNSEPHGYSNYKYSFVKNYFYSSSYHRSESSHLPFYSENSLVFISVRSGGYLCGQVLFQ